MPKQHMAGVEPQDLFVLWTVSDPQISPDGERVAYTVGSCDGESDERRSAIFVAPLDGSAPAAAFATGKRDHSPRWSPDGRYLAFVSDRGDQSQIYVAPLTGGDPRQVTRAKFGASQPAWSPDGRRIAYCARAGDWKPPKDRKPAEKAAPRVIREKWHKFDGVGYFDERRMHVFTVDVDSGETAQLTDGDCNDNHPTWSPDGRRVAFSSHRERARERTSMLCPLREGGRGSSPGRAAAQPIRRSHLTGASSRSSGTRTATPASRRTRTSWSSRRTAARRRDR